MNVGVEIDMNQINEELQKDQNMTTEGPKAEQRDRDHDQHMREVLQRRLAEQLDDTDEQPERTEEEILSIDQQNRQARATMLRKIRLKKKPVEDRKERAAPLWMVRLFKTIGVLAVVLGLLTIMAFIAWDNRDRYVQAWDKPGWHNKECIFKVGDRTVRGVREFSYQYYTVFGWTFHDTNQQKEKTFIEMPSSAASILAHMPDGSGLKLSTSDGEKGRYPIERADSYSIFMDNGKNAAVVTYQEMCR